MFFLLTAVQKNINIKQVFSTVTITNVLPRFFMNHSVVTAQDYEWELKYTRAVQPVATRRQSPYLHKPAIVKLLLLI